MDLLIRWMKMSTNGSLVCCNFAIFPNSSFFSLQLLALDWHMPEPHMNATRCRSRTAVDATAYMYCGKHIFDAGTENEVICCGKRVQGDASGCFASLSSKRNCIYLFSTFDFLILSFSLCIFASVALLLLSSLASKLLVNDANRQFNLSRHPVHRSVCSHNALFSMKIASKESTQFWCLRMMSHRHTIQFNIVVPSWERNAHFIALCVCNVGSQLIIRTVPERIKWWQSESEDTAAPRSGLPWRNTPGERKSN